MEERSLKLLNENKTFFEKVTNTLTKILTPTKIGINGMMITIKRNNLIKAFENYSSNGSKEKANRYEEAFALYLEAIDKHIMDSIYKKVKNGLATDFEKNALSQYYTVTSLKDKNYSEYKYRKQKYLLELDYETIEATGKEKIMQKYAPFYVEKMDTLYKGILKSYSIQLTDTTSKSLYNRAEIYGNIFETLDEYATEILPIKVDTDKTDMRSTWEEENEKYSKYNVGKFDEADDIERNMVLLGMSRKLFTHSLPLIAAEKCYVELIKSARDLIVKTENKKKKELTYKLLIEIIDEYNTKLLSTKVFWEKADEREEYKRFWDKCKNVQNEREKEILFIKYDLRILNKTDKAKYEPIKAFYKSKLVEYGVMKQYKNSCRTMEGRYRKENKN